MINAATAKAAPRLPVDWWQGGLMAMLFATLFAFILYPILSVLWISLSDDQNNLTLLHFVNFFRRPLFREALWNSLSSGFMVVFFSAILALPLSYVLARYEFHGKLLLQTAATLPLVIPPFVGAVALQLILGRSGMVNLLLIDWFGITIPFMEGLTGVVLVQTLHFFPFILLNTVVSLSNIDSTLEEAAENLGCHGFRRFRRVTLPLMLPGFVAGCLLTFIRAIDDLGTPLMLNYKNLLAPQAYLRITTIGIDDVDGYVVCVALVILSLASLLAARKYLSLAEYATVQRAAPAMQKLHGTAAMIVGLVIAIILGISLLPHIGIMLLSFTRVWSFTLLPTTYTLGNYNEILFRVPHFVVNTLLYTLLAAALDIILGATIAFLLLRSRVPGRNFLDAIATMPLAIPGVVLAVGYLRVFHGWAVPGLGAPLTSTWLVLVIVYAVRRLPYTVRSAYAALQQLPLSLEEAAQNLGARRARAFLKVTLPLITRGLLAGGLLAFVSSSVDLSSTMLLVPRVELGPLSYGIYLYMQSAVGRGPGAALGVVAIALVAAGTWLATRLARRGAGLFRV